MKDSDLIKHYQSIIRKALKMNNISPAKLAKMSDLNVSTLHKIINDRDRSCQINNLYRIFSALRIPFSLIDESFPRDNSSGDDVMLPLLKLKDLVIANNIGVFKKYKWRNFVSCPAEITKKASFVIRQKELVQMKNKLDPLFIVSNIDTDLAYLYLDQDGSNFVLSSEKSDYTAFNIIGEIDDI